MMKLSLYTAYFFLFRIAAARGIKSKGEKGSEAVALISRLSLHRKAKRERERERERKRERGGGKASRRLVIQSSI